MKKNKDIHIKLPVFNNYPDKIGFNINSYGNYYGGGSGGGY